MTRPYNFFHKGPLTNTAPVVTSAAALVGTPTVGVACTFTQAVATGTAPITHPSQKWQLDGVDIGGATGLTYTPLISQIGGALRVADTLTNPGGTVTSTSAAKPISAAVLSPSIVTIGAISPPSNGNVCTYTPAVVIGTPTLTSVRDWQRDGVSLGQTGLTYTPTFSDIGHTLWVVEVITSPYGSATSTSLGVAVAPAGTAPTVSVPPSILGTPLPGSVTSFAQATVAGTAPLTRTNRWTLDGVDIVSATGLSYIPTVADVGHTLRVVETVTNIYGTVTGTSAGVAVGAEVVLANQLTWSGIPLTYNGAPITYTPEVVTPPTPPAASGLPVTFALSSPATGSLPFTIGHAFKQGDVATGQSVQASGTVAQVTAKNYWPDGSLKFAIIAGSMALTANTPATVSLNVGTALVGTALTTADLAAVTASIGSSFGTVSWATTDWDSPFQTWVSGPQMSSWIYRKAVGADAHLVGWLEVRLYASGAVEVLPWIENGYVKVASPSNKSSTYTFSLGGVQRFSQAIDLPMRCRTPLLSGAAVSHWLGAAPDVTAKHDTAYMQATELVPSYRASTPLDATRLAALVTNYSPLQQGNMPGVMEEGGYWPHIGILPEWDVLYLTSRSPLPWKAAQFNAYSCGRYGTHFRDETTKRPIKFSDYPHTVINDAGVHSFYAIGASTTNDYTATGTGTVPPEYDNAHAPAMGFAAYLMTGRMYFLEELQFQATCHFLINSDNNRSTTGGVFQTSAYSNQVRGAAWCIRTLAQAACVTPDGDALSTEFLASMKANVDFYHARYVAQTNNPQGWVQAAGIPYGSPDLGTLNESTWMQDYFCAAMGYALAMQLPISGGLAKHTAFFAWNAKSPIGRLGGLTSTEFRYSDANQYFLTGYPTSIPDFATGTGPWYTTWGQIYQATLGVANPGVDAPLQGSGTSPEAYVANLLPAISYAVRHGVTGALAAYNRLITASNFPTLEAACNAEPVWAIKPYTGTTALPTWRQGQAINEWREITGSAMANFPPSINPGGNPSAKMNAWSGLSIDWRTSKVYSVANGGHGDYYGNEVDVFNLNAPVWTELLASDTTPNAVAGANAGLYTSGKPRSFHSYWAQQYIAPRNRAMFFGMGATAPTGFGAPNIEGFSTVSNTYDAHGTYPDLPSNPGPDMPVCRDPLTDNVYVFNYNINVYRWAQTSNTVLNVSNSPPGALSYCSSAYDTNRQRILLLGTTFNISTTFNVGSTDFTNRTLTGPYVTEAKGDQQAMVFDAANDRFLVRQAAAGGAVYAVDARTFATSLVTTTGGSAIPAAGTSGGIPNRFLMAPQLGGVVYFPNYATNAWFLRIT